ncbi:uncharacterized protein LOC128870100 [Anastrepha ludens]|uniref:uncharacterized protein LOC128870100 n=1 Tax=Anastrepha ludens TaxID=28586 RepID=UPI0023AF895B|nr:uncharacterized protein LOC128870100 [Anastrepha ludens]
MVLSGAEKGRVERVGAVAPPVESAVKRQRSQEEEILRPKKPRTGGGPPKSFSEVAKQAGSITLGVVDNSREDGAISRDEWKVVASAISAVFMNVVRENPGPAPCCESAGWHHGTFKRIVCADERSATMYRAAVALVGEVWKGAKLEAVDKKDLPLRPRARVWLPSEPSAPEDMEEILRYCNPKLHTHNWKVVKVEKSEGHFRQALILLNAESLGPLAETKGIITYGFEKVVMKVYQTDARGDVSATPVMLGGDRPTVVEAPVEMDVESVMSDGGSADDVRSLAGSVFSIGQLFDRAEEEGLLASDSEEADLRMLEKIIEDEDSSNKSPAL